MTSLDYYDIEELLTDEERAARDRARRFVQEEVMSEVVACHRAAKFPDHLTARMHALRLFAAYLYQSFVVIRDSRIAQHQCASQCNTFWSVRDLDEMIDRFRRQFNHVILAASS